MTKASLNIRAASESGTLTDTQQDNAFAAPRTLALVIKHEGLFKKVPLGSSSLSATLDAMQSFVELSAELERSNASLLAALEVYLADDEALWGDRPPTELQKQARSAIAAAKAA